MKNRIIVLMSLFLVVLSAYVLGAGAISQPGGSNGVIRNASMPVIFWVAGNTSHVCSVSALSTSTNCSSTVTFGNVSNTTTQLNNFTFTLNTNTCEDAPDYTFTIICTNATTQNTLTTTSVVIDNTNPDVPTSLTSGDKTTGTFDATATVTASKTNSCTLYLEGQSPITAPSCSQSGATCTCSFVNAPQYVYDYSITASDGSNVSQKSSTARLIVKTSTSRGSPATRATTVTGQVANTQPLAVPTTPSSSDGVLGGFLNAIVNFFKSLFA